MNNSRCVYFKSRAFAKKIRESSDYDEPSDFSTEKFKNMGKLASGFSSRFIKNMTSVNFGDVLTDGSLVGVDFPKDSVSTGILLKTIVLTNASIYCTVHCVILSNIILK